MACQHTSMRVGVGRLCRVDNLMKPCDIVRFRGVSELMITKRALCYEARKVDIMSGKQTFMFDTHALVRSLQTSGFSMAEAEALTDSLAQIVNANMEHQNKTMVTKAQQEILLQQVMAHIAAVKKDMIILEKSEFSSLKHENEKQRLEIEQLKKELSDSLEKLRAGIMLDVNLEKSRAMEAHADSERLLARLDNRIDKEIATLIAKFEGYRNDMFKYAAGAVLSCLTITLGFYRLWSS